MIRKEIYFLLLTILVSCNSGAGKDSTQKAGKEQQYLTKNISQGDFNVKIIIANEKIRFEILHRSRHLYIEVQNELGKISFTKSLPFVCYSKDSTSTIGYIFQNNEFLIFPFEDWNGNRIIYKIPLYGFKQNKSIHPLFILKEKYCLFNKRTATLVTYENSDKEYLIRDESYFLTVLRIYHLTEHNSSDFIEFSTQKNINISENSSPTELKQKLLMSMRSFYESNIYDEYLK